ncbi:hypothetical protein DFJ73DRAFT_768399 [Zopfochytrium polystomum]|nr:hypothetical protein DFJ73DRAFT_768399 [Zopfochytrium polystomum]
MTALAALLLSLCAVLSLPVHARPAPTGSQPRRAHAGSITDGDLNALEHGNGHRRQSSGNPPAPNHVPANHLANVGRTNAVTLDDNDLNLAERRNSHDGAPAAAANQHVPQPILHNPTAAANPLAGQRRGGSAARVHEHNGDVRRGGGGRGLCAPRIVDMELSFSRSVPPPVKRLLGTHTSKQIWGRFSRFSALPRKWSSRRVLSFSPSFASALIEKPQGARGKRAAGQDPHLQLPKRPGTLSQ